MIEGAGGVDARYALFYEKEMCFFIVYGGNADFFHNVCMGWKR